LDIIKKNVVWISWIVISKLGTALIKKKKKRAIGSTMLQCGTFPHCI